MAGREGLFYDTVQRVPFIVMDPSGEADATRGQALDHMVESVDLVPTVLRALDAPGRHRLEGRELQEVLHGLPDGQPWRDCVYSGWTTASARPACCAARRRAMPAWSLRTDRWRYVYWLDEPEQLYDLRADPEEFQDLGTSAAYAEVRGALPAVCWNGCCAAAPAPR